MTLSPWPSAAAPGPYVVLWVVDAAEGLTQQGPDGLSIGRVQVDCYGGAYTEAKRLARAVIAALTGARQRGFQGVFHVGTRDSREGGSNEAVRPYRCSLDFETFWTET